MGERGGGWVVGQFVLIAAVVATAVLIPHGDRPAVFGGLLIVAGLGLSGWSVAALGHSLTPYPTPVPDGELVTRGPYAVVRHPIYSGLLLVLLGVVSLGSAWALLPLAALLGWWLAKARVEERHLRARYPGYDEYCQRVRGRIVPYLL